MAGPSLRAPEHGTVCFVAGRCIQKGFKFETRKWENLFENHMGEKTLSKTIL